jgi:TonB-linked SusC/RagA family outer membrane protein
MKKAFTALLFGLLLVPAVTFAQARTVTGTVTNEAGAPLQGISVVVKGTQVGTVTDAEGKYSVSAQPGQVLQFRFVGTSPQERTITQSGVVDVQLKRVAANLDAVVVTALGQTTSQRAIGTSQQSVMGSALADTKRLNFLTALSGRVAGVEVIPTSGVPGASTSITVRGISSISSSNQPLMIVDGLPLDNKTMHSSVLASGRPGSANSFENRSIDFTNRAADINPEDIESVVVLKGAEAAALYGIDAANGAVVITTKRGQGGVNMVEYSNNFSFSSTSVEPDLQRQYDVSGLGSTAGYLYWGDPYPTGTTFYDNIDGFFRTGKSMQHNLSVSGGSSDRRITYRVAGTAADENAVVRNADLTKYNLTGSSTAQVKKWLTADLSMIYAHSLNHQPYKGVSSPLLGLLVWPQTDNAKDYLTSAGTRRRLTTLAASNEYDNPYFNVEKNRIEARTNRLVSNISFTLIPVSWGYLKTNFGVDNYTNQNLILRHPESAAGFTYNGVLDVGDDVTRNINSQTLLNLNSRQIAKDLNVTAMLGNAIRDEKSGTDAMTGQDFLDPNFVSINNTALRFSQSTITQRRVVSGFGQATLDWRNYLYFTFTGRNDWTSTIPSERNSFFYPSYSGSFVFSDAFPSIGKYVTGKLRAARAEVGRDARPYSYRPSLEFKPTSYGGYGYGFTGPNRKLKPEFAKSWELGTELGFLGDRLSVDATYYSKQTFDQIVQNVRGSYGTGYVLFNLNGAITRNQGWEITGRATPIERRRFTWEVLANFDHAWGKTLALPNALPESYNADTWLFGNIRNGTKPGLSTRSLTGWFYQRNKDGKILIDPANGLPLKHADFIDGGYDRQPDFMLGLNNSFRYRDFSLNFLFDFRRGGDILNATQHFLTVRGLSTRTLDRWEPRVVDGILRDGKENTATPTVNTIIVVPALNTSYYDSISEELFIEKDINWLRLRDLSFSWMIPQRFARDTRAFVTATDLFLITNYSGLDPLGSATTVATGGSGSAGIDYGGFPLPRTVSFGIRTALR